MHRFSTLHRLGVLAVALTLTTTPASAQTCTTEWTNPDGGSWSDAANWSAGVPGASDDACITLDGTYTVTLDTAATVNGLTLGQASGAGTQTLSHLGFGPLTVNAASTIQARGVFDWRGSFAGELTNDGLMVIGGTGGALASLAGLETTIVNNALAELPAGLLRFDGNNIQFINAASGTFEVQDENGFTFDACCFGNTFTNNGVFRRTGNAGTSLLTAGIAFDNNGTVVAEMGTIRFETTGTHTDATFDAAAGAEIFFNGQYGGGTPGTHTVIGTISGDPAGTIRMGGAAVLEGDSTGAVIDFGGTGFEWQGGTFAGDVTNAGLFRKSGDTGTSVLGDVTFTNMGVISVDSGEVAIVNEVFNHAAGALIQGSGLFDISEATFSHLGDTGPGTSPGILTWENDWTPDDGSTLFIELGGTGAPVAGDDYDQLAVVGAATLAGTLELQIAVGDAPQIGDTYTILTAGGGVAGTFDTVVGPFGYSFDVTYNANDVVLEVLTVPNFDLAAQNTDPTGSPIVVAKPGAIDFAYSITNNTAAPITGDVFFTASLGTNVLAQGVILSGSVPANSSSPALSFTQGVPGIAPVGTYTYSIKIGQFPSVVVDQVDFTVEVTAASARETDESGEQVWAVQAATPWLTADGSVLMAAAEQGETEAETEAASAAVPEAFGLAAAYPNPFRASTAFALAVPEAARVSVAVYDALGRRVATLLDEEVEAATHRVVWDASDLPSGVYLVRAAGAGATAAQRATLVR